MVDKYEAIIDRLKVLKVKCGKTNQQIAKDSNVPESTVTRIFSGKTTNPTISTVLAMTKAMGGSVIDLFDDTVKVDVVSEAPQVVVPQVDERLYSEIIGVYKDLIKTKDKWIKALFVVAVSLGIFLLAVVLIDVLNGGIGFVRH